MGFGIVFWFLFGEFGIGEWVVFGFGLSLFMGTVDIIHVWLIIGCCLVGCLML